MRLAWLSSDSVAEGALGVTDRIEGARAFLRRGHEVTIVCGARPGARPFENIPTRFVPTGYAPFLAWASLWPGVARELEGLRPDAVLSDTALLPPAVRHAATGHTAVVLDVRSHPVEVGTVRLAAQRLRFRATLRRYGRRVDAITTISEGLRRAVARSARVPEDRIAIWTSGCAWAESDLEPVEPAILPGEPGDTRFLYQGSLSAGRGLFQTVRGFALATTRERRIRLAFLGAGAARGDLEREARALGIGDRVSFHEPVPHDGVPAYLAAADVGIAPWPPTWDMEVNAPLKLVEYLSFGMPVVVTDIVPHRIVPSEAPFAFWAGRGDPEGLASAMLAARAVAADLPRLGREARAWAAPRLGWSAQLDILEEVLERGVAARARVRVAR